MKKNSNAYQLIKSLTMSEKRYFKIFSERHTIGSQNKYVMLFDVIDEANEENDVDLKKSLRQLGINADFLSADKNYLYQLLLRSLNDFHTSKTFNITVKELLLSIEILFHKGLYHECLKLIEKAQKQAEECENFQLMLDVLTWKKKCSGYSLGLMKAAEVNLSMDRYINLLENLKKITDLYYESNILQANNEKYSNEVVTKKFKEILKNPLLKKETNALSFSAKIFYHLIYSNYYFTIDNKVKELDHLQQLINILNTSKSYSIENPLDYVSIYNRFLSVKKFFPDDSFFDDIKQLKSFIDKVPIRKDVAEQRVFIHTNTHELEYYLITNNFPKALLKNSEIEKGIAKLDMDVELYHMIYFYYLNAIVLVFVGQYNKALKYINKAINEFDFNARPQVFMRLEVLNIILHFELKNYSLAASLTKQLLRKNGNLNILLTFEEHILTAVYKITTAKHITLKEENNILQTLLQEIEDLKVTNVSLMKSMYENYEKWITAKIKRKTVSELYKVIG